MDLNLHVWDFTPLGPPAGLAPALAAVARTADDAGLGALTCMDHWFQMEAVAPAEDPMLEGYSTLAFLAGQTSRLELGLLVTGVTYRHPGLLAKTVATLDVLSGGRAFLGIGAAWYEREHRGLGVPFPPLAERFARLEETLRICRQMWSGDVGGFAGEHHRLAETLCRPLPLRRVPVLVGGMGEQKTLRLVARYGDACNLFDAGPDVLRHKLEVLDRHCADLGRDPAEVRRTIITQQDPLADVDAFLARMQEYAGLGIDAVWVGSAGADLLGRVERLGQQVLPRLRELGPPA